MTGLSLEIPLLVLSIIIHAITGHGLEEYAQQTGGVVLVSEGLVAVLLGSLVGFLLKYAAQGEVVELESDIFWYFVLPPIMMVQAFQQRRKIFFRQLPSMLVFGFLGTLLNFGLLVVVAYYMSRWSWVWREGCHHNLFARLGESADEPNNDPCLDDFSLIKSALLSAILCASDGMAALKHLPDAEGNRHVVSLILGESVLNEAISILLFKAAFDDYVKGSRSLDHLTGLRALSLLCAGIGVGVVVGLGLCRILLRLPSLRRAPARQVGLVLLFCYLSYGMAEYLALSGTLTLLFTALTISRYGSCNLSTEARKGSRLTVELFASVAEGFSFVYVGFSLSGLTGRYPGRFSVLIFVATIVCRLLTTLLLFLGLQRWKTLRGRPLPLLSWQELVTFAVAGMIKGNVSWAQALQVRELDHEISSTVLVVVLLSMVVSETILPLLLRRLYGPTNLNSRRPRQKRSHGGSEEDILYEEGDELEASDGYKLLPSDSSSSSSSCRAMAEGERRGACWLVCRGLRTLDHHVFKPFFSGVRGVHGESENDEHRPTDMTRDTADDDVDNDVDNNEYSSSVVPRWLMRGGGAEGASLSCEGPPSSTLGLPPRSSVDNPEK